MIIALTPTKDTHEEGLSKVSKLNIVNKTVVVF